jgi:hypothetical protein
MIPENILEKFSRKKAILEKVAKQLFFIILW